MLDSIVRTYFLFCVYAADVATAKCAAMSVSHIAMV